MRTSRNSNDQQSLEEIQAGQHKSKLIFPTAPLPDPIGENIEAVIALHTRGEKKVSRHQRIIEAVTTFFSRPAFLYCILLVVFLWVLPNVLPRRFGLRQFDPPPFYWLQGAVGLSALLMTAGVLIRQSRQAKLAEQRAQLSLQLHLLTEQKIAKLIALIEELRNDLPDVEDRYDIEAETMKQATDPYMVMDVLEKNLEAELTKLQNQGSSDS
jgi:uncharacterized membrane protein